VKNDWCELLFKNNTVRKLFKGTLDVISVDLPIKEYHLNLSNNNEDIVRFYPKSAESLMR